jgi:hypothetical protein
MNYITIQSGQYKSENKDKRKEALIDKFNENLELTFSAMYKFEQEKYHYWKTKIKEYNKKSQIIDAKIQEYQLSGI